MQMYTTMTGVLAAAAAPGVAGAGMVNTVLDTFDSSSSSSFINVNTVNTSLMAMDNWSNWGRTGGGSGFNYQAGANANGTANGTWATAAQGGGSLNLSLMPSGSSGSLTNNTPTAGVNRIRYNSSTSSASSVPSNSATDVFDLSGKGDIFYFDGLVQAGTLPSGSSSVWIISAKIGAAGNAGIPYSARITEVGTLVDGRYFVNFSDLKNSSNQAWTTGYDQVFEISIGLSFSGSTTGLAAGSNLAGSMSEFGIIPAPGAIALLGAAGLVGSRRRR